MGHGDWWCCSWKLLLKMNVNNLMLMIWNKKRNIQNIFSACAFFSGWFSGWFSKKAFFFWLNHPLKKAQAENIFWIFLFLFHIMSIRLFTFILIILIMLKGTLNHIQTFIDIMHIFSFLSRFSVAGLNYKSFNSFEMDGSEFRQFCSFRFHFIIFFANHLNWSTWSGYLFKTTESFQLWIAGY